MSSDVSQSTARSLGASSTAGVVDVSSTPGSYAPTMPVQAGETVRPRLFYMDSMRTTMMLGIVVLHVSNIYAPLHNWIVADSQQSMLYNWIVDFCDTFMLQVFYIIAGFFAVMSLQKTGVAQFFKTRMWRIAIPLVCTGLTINSAELYLRSVMELGYRPHVMEFWRETLLPAWSNGGWVSHLWFLVTLLQFFAVTPLVLKVGRWLSQFSIVNKAAHVLRRHCLFLLLLPVVRLLMLAFDKLFPEVYQATLFFGTISVDDFLAYCPYFLVGLWLFSDNKAQSEFTTSYRWQMFVYLPVLVGFLMLRDQHGVNVLSVTKTYLEGLVHCLHCQFCFVLFYKYMNRQIPAVSKLSDMSYTIYLFHHIIVIGLGFALAQVQMPIAIKFFAIITVALGVPMLIHQLVIRRIPILSLLYNGKRS